MRHDDDNERLGFHADGETPQGSPLRDPGEARPA